MCPDEADEAQFEVNEPERGCVASTSRSALAILAAAAGLRHSRAPLAFDRPIPGVQCRGVSDPICQGNGAA